jgi:hypothetical protein
VTEYAHPADLPDLEREPGWKVGHLRPTRNPVTSKVEEHVRAALVSAGYDVPPTKMAVVCHNPDDRNRLVPITPDVVLPAHRLAIEVDPCGASPEGGGTTHRGKEEDDRTRNRMLRAAHWSVIRLRLGAQKGGHIGRRDVVVESASLTKAARQALLMALEDAINKRPAQVRFVPKGKTPATPRYKTNVRNIRPDTYTDDGHRFWWFPDRASADKRKMELHCGGRFLYADEEFLADVGLHEVPAAEWRQRLEDLLGGYEPKIRGTGKWPWGPTLFVSPTEGAVGAALIERIEDKATMGKATIQCTTNCSSLAVWDERSLLTEAKQAIAQLHDEAFILGYRVTDVQTFAGRRGRYERILVTRQLGGVKLRKSNP